jgi:ketosteroid isomerase-like protein
VAVTDRDLEHIRRAFAEFTERYDKLREEGELERYHAEFYVSDSVIENVDGFPIPGRYEGFAGYREGFGDSYGNYRDVRWRVESIEPAGDYVLALVRAFGKPADDDVELELALGMTYEMRDGRIAYARVYVGHERAREAALS